MTDLLANAVPVDVEKPEADDARMWSVTTIIKALDKPALVPWAARVTAAEAVRVAHRLVQMVDEDGADEVINWLSAARFRKPKGKAKKADESGTAVHDVIERFALTGERPTDVDPDIVPYLDQFTRWAQKAQPEYLAAEMTVYDERYGYAGTLDAVVKVQGSTFVVDYKSTAKSDADPKKIPAPYPEVALQLAAYRYAEFAAAWRVRRFEHYKRRYYLLGPEERAAAVEIPKVDGGLALSITPTHCNAHPVRCDETVHTSFLYVIEAARWVFETSRGAIGDPLVFPEVAA